MNFIFDWDGTLGGSDGKIKQHSIVAIKKIKKLGHEVIIATGRHTSDILRWTQDYKDVVSFIIGGNGSFVYDVGNNKMILSNVMPQKYVQEIVSYVKRKESLLLYLDIQKEWVCHFSTTKKYYVYPDNIEAPYVSSSDIKRLSSDIFFLELRFMDENKLIENHNILSNKYHNVLSTTTSHTNHINITNKNINKWSSIKWLMKRINNSNKNIAFGDSMNDQEMIQNADIGVVMGNGAAELKKIADQVIGDCNTDTILTFVNNIEKHPNIFHEGNK